VTYPEAGFSAAIGCFLIESLQVTVYKGYRGWRTPYPQKRQQTLGATLAELWKTAESRDKSRFARGLPGESGDLVVF
jgi:hypothetical protein